MNENTIKVGQTTIPLNEKGDVSLMTAMNFIKDFTASKIEEDNALVVTAHLANGQTLSDLYSTSSKEEFTPDLALDSCKMKLTHKVWELLNAVKAIATMETPVQVEDAELVSK